MALLFWIALGAVGYTYVGYPLGLMLLARLKAKGTQVAAANDAQPPVTVVIAAWNEAANLPRKIRSINASDYSGDVHIIVASDGSDDDTEKVIGDFPNVTLISLPTRQGKPSALNAAMAQVKTAHVVFTDARQTLKRDAIARLIRRLQDERVGAVSGELVQIAADSQESVSVGLYWKYEKWIRQNESLVHSVPGVSGALYAIRTEDFSPLPSDTILDDFEVPIGILRKGKQIKFESGAIMYDQVEADSAAEQRRKIRTLLGNYQSFRRNLWLFHPRQNPIWLQFMSHKVLRLVVPYWMVALLVTPLFLQGIFYQLFLLTEGGFYLAVLVAKVIPASRGNRLIGFCNVFWDMNLSAVIALKRYLTNEIDVRWQKRPVGT